MSKSLVDYYYHFNKISSLISNIPVKHYLKVENCYNLLISKNKPLSRLFGADYKVFYVEKGECIVSILGKEIAMQKGNILFINIKDSILFQSISNYVHIIVVTFNLHETNSKRRVQAYETPYFLSFTPGRYSYYNQMFENILMQHTKALNPLSEMICSTATSHLMGEIFNTQYYRANNFNTVDPRLIDSKHLIDSNPSATLNVEDLAKRLNLSSKHFTLIFKGAFGTTPKKYILKKKMDYAKTLLTNGNMNVKDVSRAVGYPDQYSFSKQFKKVIGVNPSAIIESKHQSIEK